MAKIETIEDFQVHVLAYLHHKRTEAFEDDNEDAMLALDLAYRYVSKLPTDPAK